MELLMHLFKVWVSDMSVNLGGSYIAMAKHSLDTSKGGSIH